MPSPMKRLGGRGTAAAALRARVRAIRRATRFVWRSDSSELAQDIDEVRSAIVANVVPDSPRVGADLLRDLVCADDRVFERVDDSDGLVADVFREAVLDWGRAWCAISERQPAELAALVFAEHENNDYGIKDGVVSAFADALGKDGLAELQRLFRAKLDTVPVPPDNHFDSARLRLGHGLADVADALHDVDAFIEAMAQIGWLEIAAVDIGRRLLSAGRPEEALAALDRKPSRSGFGEQGVTDVRIAVLEALDRPDAAQAERWDTFARTLSVEHFEQHVVRVHESRRRAVTENAIAHAQQYPLMPEALHFLVAIGAHAQAAALVIRRLSDVDGSVYWSFRRSADALAPTQPLAAILLHRAMASAVLDKAQSKYYRYAAKDLARAAELEPSVAAWLGFPPHAAHMAALRSQHARKYAFWNLMDTGFS